MKSIRQYVYELLGITGSRELLREAEAIVARRCGILAEAERIASSGAAAREQRRGESSCQGDVQ